MHRVLQLIKLYFLSTLNINDILKAKNKSKKIQKVLFNVFLLIFIFIIAKLFYKLCDYMILSYIPLGLINLIVPQMMAFTSIIVFVLSLYMVNGILFGFKDYDTLMSLPISKKIIITSRLFIIYLLTLIIPIFIMGITLMVYSKYAVVNSIFYILYISLTFILPLVPIILGCIIGSIITYISGKFHLKNVVQFIIFLTVILGVIFVLMTISSSSNLEVANFGLKMMDVVRGIYPLSDTYIKIIVTMDLLSTSIFTILPIVLFAFFIYFLPFVYSKINTSIFSYNTSKKFVFKSLKVNSPFISLYKKELKKYFSSITYMLNTMISLVVFTITTVLVIIFGIDKLETILNVVSIKEIITPLLPLIIGVFVVLSSTTSSSISLEGKSFWLIKSSPIKMTDLILSKVLVNLTVVIPFVLVNTILLSVYLKVSPYSFIMMFIFPFVYALFISLVGIMANLYYPNFTFTSEIEVIRQSSASLFTNIVGIISILIPFILIFKTATLMPDTVISFMSVIIFIVDIMLYSYLFKIAPKLIRKMSI